MHSPLPLLRQPFHRLTGAALLTCALLAVASPASARPGTDWGQPGWGDSAWDRPAPSTRRSGPDPREGKVIAETFATQGESAALLGHGPITVTSQASGENAAIEGPAYEAAVVSELIAAGYDTVNAEGAPGQHAELRVLTTVAQPAEGKRDPVSGEAVVGVSNRGSMAGLALNFDFTEPRKALLSTRLEIRILDQRSGEALWEGRATILTREGDDDWTAQDIAARLAGELFRRFPRAEGMGPALP